jgi:hypothetical protein
VGGLATAAAHQRDKPLGGAVQDPVVAPVAARAGLGFLVSPVFELISALLSPTIGMQRFQNKHGDASLMPLSNQALYQVTGEKKTTFFGIAPFSWLPLIGSPIGSKSLQTCP